MIRRIAILTTFICVTAGQTLSFAQEAQGAFSAEQYKKALWMVTRFYGGQRSGSGPNWILMGHPNTAYRTAFTNDRDSVTGHDLSGGWFDCGDNMKFGQTFFFTVYKLATAYEAFPTGFHDLYNGGAARSDFRDAYSDYLASNDWSITGGVPNGIPDLLEELKYAADWIIKATPDENTFYFEKGYAPYDHSTWVTGGFMSTRPVTSGGEPRPIRKNPDDGVMASFAAAALSTMSRIYRKYDAAYADLCLEHAKIAYAYAKPRKDLAVNSVSPHSGTTTPCYTATKYPVTVFIAAAAEMYRTTGEQTYRDDINENTPGAGGTLDWTHNHWWAFNYENPNDLTPYALACALPSAKNTHLQYMKTSFLDRYTNPSNINVEKVSAIEGTEWGALRYAANHAFSAAIYSAATGTSDYDQFIYDQIDYILGANEAKQSFVVGFCEECEKEVRQPHHANVYLSDANTINSVTIPERNRYHGLMVGGTHRSGVFPDNIGSYQTAEGGSDYNAGLVGALAYIVSKLAPADTNSFTSTQKNLTRRTVSKNQSVFVSNKNKMVVFSAAQGRTIERLSIHTLSGRQVFKHNGSISEVRWKESTAPRGLYLARITLNGGAVVQRNVLLK